MIFKLIEKKGIKDAVLKNVDTRLTKGHGNLGTLLKTKAVDAVVMWNGVAYTFRESLDLVKTAYEYDEEIRVHVIGLSYSKQAEAVKKFVDFAKSEGTPIFAKHGYTK
jgi:ABC-type molybdate transport system substrate-binding protein